MSDSSQINSDNLSSTLLNIQSLESEFKNVLKQYEQAHLDYLNIDKIEFETIPDAAYFKSSNNGSGYSHKGISLDECKALCSGDVNCTGASYTQFKDCLIVSEPGFVYGKGKYPGDFALVVSKVTEEKSQQEDKTQQREIINTKIDDLNTKLMSINQKISKELDDAIPDIQTELSLKNVDKNHLQTTYNKLLDDRMLIKKRIGEYKQVSSEYNDTKLYVNMENSHYILWFIIAVLVLLYTIKIMFFQN